MLATRALRQAAAHAERVPSIKFIGKRSIPASVDHSPRAHPASPSGSLPADFSASSHHSFSEYRQRSQQYGPLQKTWARTAEGGIGGASGAALPSIEPANGFFFDRDDLPARFRRTSWTVEEIEAIESGGASAFA
ncbi:hypothetical protein F5883DRAFT_522393 [Diaporthe sp. PMI_573]|nr:hypothetical protein F5883DRAFT_522393 [Diaporthaceae sp. PMI_573]